MIVSFNFPFVLHIFVRPVSSLFLLPALASTCRSTAKDTCPWRVFDLPSLQRHTNNIWTSRSMKLLKYYCFSSLSLFLARGRVKSCKLATWCCTMRPSGVLAGNPARKPVPVFHTAAPKSHVCMLLEETLNKKPDPGVLVKSTSKEGYKIPEQGVIN